jgi:hypothetical protein
VSFAGKAGNARLAPGRLGARPAVAYHRPTGNILHRRGAKLVKVFPFFFSKKKRLLALAAGKQEGASFLKKRSKKLLSLK